MLKTSYIELNKNALHNNLNYLRNQVCKGARYSMVIKANGYGHGIEDILPIAEECGIDHFSVFSISEAMRAYKVKDKNTQLMIMGWIDHEELEWAIRHDIAFYVFSYDRLYHAQKKAMALKKTARIHLELETGMHRIGFCKKELNEAIAFINKHRNNFLIEGVSTHFAGAESINNYDRIQQQIKTYNELCLWLCDKGLQPKYRHTACSAAALRYPSTIMDMVRIGISSYGFWPSNELRMSYLYQKEIKGEKPIDPLLRVLSWKSAIMSINTVAAGEYVSYGKSFMTNRDTVIATVPVGYGYGYTRNLSNMGHVLVGGKRVNVIGSVNMNMMVVDITDLKEVHIGDEVVLIGSQLDQTITVSSFADMTNSLNYELLSRLPGHIPRYVI